MQPVDVSRDSSRDITDYRRARSFPGYRVVVHVPFEGDGNIFHLRTNTFNFNPPRGRVSKSDLIKTIEYERDAKPNIDGIVNEFTSSTGHGLAGRPPSDHSALGSHPSFSELA